MGYNSASIKLNPGNFAPRYTADDVQLELEEVVITEEGTRNGWPLVDFVMKDKAGKKHFFMVTGSIAQMIAGAVRGVNVRIHGKEEPDTATATLVPPEDQKH